MIFTKFNLVAFIVLLIINIIPIYNSHRRKKFSYFSIRIFVPVFATYWTLLLIYFQTFDFLNAGATINRPGVYKKPVTKYETTSAIKSTYENDTKYKIVKLNKIMTVAAIQCVIVILFAAFGIIWLNDRVIYYTRVILIFTALLIFCICIIKTGGITGYDVFT